MSDLHAKYYVQGTGNRESAICFGQSRGIFPAWLRDFVGRWCSLKAMLRTFRRHTHTHAHRQRERERSRVRDSNLPEQRLLVKTMCV